MKKTCVVGMGKMGIVHASILNCIPTTELVAVSDMNKNQRRILQGVGIHSRFYESAQEMIQKENPDAVFICVPSCFNHVIAETCANYNVSMFVEKPLANTLENAEKILEFTNRIDTKNSMGFMLSYIPTFRKAKEFIDAHMLGEIQKITTSINLSAVFNHQKAWFYRKDMSGGGAMVALGSHLIFLLHWFFGPINQVQAKLVYESGNEVEDGGKVELKLANGTEVSMDVSWSTIGYENMASEMFIHGSKGKLAVNNKELHHWSDKGELKTIHISELGEQSKFYLGGEGYFGEDEEFIAAIGTNHHTHSTFEDGYEVQKVLNAIYDSAETGRDVMVTA